MSDNSDYEPIDEPNYGSDEDIPHEVIEESVRMAQTAEWAGYQEESKSDAIVASVASSVKDTPAIPAIKEKVVAESVATSKEESKPWVSKHGHTECQVCCEEFSKTVYAIDCPYCFYSSCVKCCKYYIVNTAQNAHCMSCKKVWNRAFLSSVLPAKFLFTDYKVHRENMLLEMEKAYLPATQVLIQPLKTKESLNRMYKYVDLRISMLTQKGHSQENQDKIENQEWLKKLVQQKIHNVTMLYNKLQNGGVVTDKEEKKFIMKCPAGDCRGFLSQRYKCGICNTKFCSKCHEPLTGTVSSDEPEEPTDQADPLGQQASVEDSKDGDEKEPIEPEEPMEQDGDEKVDNQDRTFHKSKKHVCDPNTVESVLEIKKSTRNCPNCHVSIYKSSGCDQMWCIQCHTAFNWKTGAIEKGIIHNPEYFEFIRKSGLTIRNPYEQLCGGMPDYTSLLYKIARLRGETKALNRYYQLVTHIRQVALRRLPTPIDNVNNQDLRIEYLMGKITEDDFKVKLQRRQKEREHRLEYRQCLDTFVTVGEELFRQLYSGAIDLEVFNQQIAALSSMTNKSIQGIASIYQVRYDLLENTR